MRMASRKGFEPLTPGLGNLCSILLSYRDVRLRVIDRKWRKRKGPARGPGLWISSGGVAYAASSAGRSSSALSPAAGARLAFLAR